MANRLAIRLALPLVLLGMTALGAAGPAHAAPPPITPPPPTVEITVPERVITTDSGTDTVPVEVSNIGFGTATGLVLEFGSATAPVDPRIGLQLPASCQAASCPLDDLAQDVSKTYQFPVRPTADLPAAGLSFGLLLHDATGLWKKSATVTVLRAARGIDLETAQIPEIKLAAGKSAVLPISVRNNGTEATEGVAIALTGERYITFPNNYSNCVDVAEPAGIVCSFDLSLAPGSVFTISAATPLTVEADKAAPGPADYKGGLRAFGIEKDATDAGPAAAQRAAGQPGGKLELVPAAQSLAAASNELNEWDNSTTLTVKVALNPADSVAIGDAYEGKIGDTSTVEVGVRNDGPATVLGPSGDWRHSVQVRTPSGLKATKVDKRCVPNGDGEPSWDMPGQVSGHDYLCVVSAPLAAGKTELFSFTGEILDGKNEDPGTVTVLGGVQDQNLSNNTASADVKLTGADAGGSGGGLPITGAPAGQIAVTGLLLVLLGAFTLVLTRRRPVA